MKDYQCLYNHDMCSIASCITPRLNYEQEITRQQVECFVDDVAGTDVDAFLCCPTMLRRALWHSEIDPHWSMEAGSMQEPTLTHDWKYLERIYYRLRRYLLSGGDPVRETYEACRRNGLDFFISYRMNDNHVLEQPWIPTIDSFWRDHPEYRIGSFTDAQSLVNNTIAAQMQNYLLPEVRQHYMDILQELVRLFDIDGLELDLMRAPCYFAPAMLAEGTLIMTEFVRGIRKMLDHFGNTRHMTIPLCVRVPPTLKLCQEIGLDVQRWDQEELINMVNVSSNFHQTMELNIEEFRTSLSHARIYGEMQFATAPGKTAEGFGINRNTTREIYQTTACNFLSRGAHGLSFYNFTFARHHHFNEPRRAAYPGTEPPFDILRGICDQQYLAKLDKHYFSRTGYGVLPARNEAAINLLTNADPGDYKYAILRIECSNVCRGIPVTVQLNQEILEELESSGELFNPLTIEALPRIEWVRYFQVPLRLIKTGSQSIQVHFVQTRNSVTIAGIELAMYN